MPRDVDQEIEEESATVLPSREAMSIVDPTIVTRIVPPETPQPTTSPGVDESNPEGSA